MLSKTVFNLASAVNLLPPVKLMLKKMRILSKMWLLKIILPHYTIYDFGKNYRFQKLQSYFTFWLLCITVLLGNVLNK